MISRSFDAALPPPPPPPPIKIANKNAFEIRADILAMAIQWLSLEDGFKPYKKPTEDELLALAKKFYEFVAPNRRES
jgi:hypothetical protein